MEDHMVDYQKLLKLAFEEAMIGYSEGGVPVGALLADQEGNILGRGHNMRVQNGDPTIHGETAAFKNAGRQRGYKNKILVTTLSPCWYCSGLIKQFNIGQLIVGDSVNFKGGQDWLAEQGVNVIDLQDPDCIEMMQKFISQNPDLWAEDIGD
jgi:cytosine/creatinine deaminase